MGDPDWLPGVGGSGLTRDVQMTSRKLMFIQLSQLTRCPLYVSPFFSSTSCKRRESRGASPAPVQGPAPVSLRPGQAVGPGRAAGTHHRVVLRRLQQGQGQLREEKRREASGTAGKRDGNRDTERDTERNTVPTAPGSGEKRTRPCPRLQPPPPRAGPAATHHRAGAAEPPPRRALPLKPPPAPRGANQSAARPRRSQSERGTRPRP